MEKVNQESCAGCVHAQYPACCNSCVRRYGDYPDRYADERDFFIVDDRVFALSETWPDNLYRAVLGIEAEQYRRRPKHLEERIDKVLEYLPEREQLVLRMRYEAGCTLKEIGDAIGVSLERVRQIERRATRKLRIPALSQQLVFGSFSSELAGGVASKGVAGAAPGDIRKLHLGLRLHGALVRAGLFTVAEVSALSESDMKAIPGIGEKGTKELQQALESITTKELAACESG